MGISAYQLQMDRSQPSDGVTRSDFVVSLPVPIRSFLRFFVIWDGLDWKLVTQTVRLCRRLVGTIPRQDC